MDALLARTVPTEPCEGKALRVSIGLGFRVPKLKQPEMHLGFLTNQALLPAERMHDVAAARLDNAALVKSLSVAMQEISARLPAGPVAATAGKFDRCDVVRHEWPHAPRYAGTEPARG